MKAILKFDLNDPDDKEEYRIVRRAYDMYRAIDEIREFLRSQYKYGDNNSITYSNMLDKFWEILKSWDLTEVINK